MYEGSHSSLYTKPTIFLPLLPIFYQSVLISYLELSSQLPPPLSFSSPPMMGHSYYTWPKRATKKIATDTPWCVAGRVIWLMVVCVINERKCYTLWLVESIHPPHHGTILTILTVPTILTILHYIRSTVGVADTLPSPSLTIPSHHLYTHSHTTLFPGSRVKIPQFPPPLSIN